MIAIISFDMVRAKGATEDEASDACELDGHAEVLWFASPADFRAGFFAAIFTCGESPASHSLIELPWAAALGAPGLLLYVVVADLAATLADVERLGGRVVVERIDIAGIGAFAAIADPEAKALGLFQPARQDRAGPVPRERLLPV